MSQHSPASSQQRSAQRVDCCAGSCCVPSPPIDISPVESFAGISCMRIRHTTRDECREQSCCKGRGRLFSSLAEVTASLPEGRGSCFRTWARPASASRPMENVACSCLRCDPKPRRTRHGQTSSFAVCDTSWPRSNDDEPVFFGQPFRLVAIIPDRVDGTALVG